MKVSIRTKNITKRSIFFHLSLIMFLFSMVVLPVRAASTDSVTATVTVQNISVSVSDGAIAYGTLALNSSAGTNGIDTQTAENDGNVTVDFNIRGQDTANWTLGATADSDLYVHRFCTETCDSAPTNYTALTTNYQTLAESKAAEATQTFDLHISTPTSTANYTEQSADVTVQAALP